MHYHIVTLFPDAFDSYLGESIIKRAIEDKKIKVSLYNPRDFTKDKFKPKSRQAGSAVQQSWNRRIDQKPYGGGPGMVIQAEPVLKAVAKAIGRKDPKSIKVIFFSPSGVEFTNDYAEKVSKKYKHIVMICGRYEGIDARVQKILKAEEVSIGPFVLTGGELPAMLVMDVVSRRIPGVLGNIDSLEENRVSASEVYTRPEELKWKGKNYAVPDVLLSGHHQEIEKWKKDR